MSDLAPFVAAVLKDGVTADLLQENEELREQLRQACKLVTVTGPGGSPVYAHGVLDLNGQLAEGMTMDEMWTVEVERNAVPCRIEDVRNIEIRLVGSEILGQFGEFGTYEGAILTYVNEHTMQPDVIDENGEASMMFFFNAARDVGFQVSLGTLNAHDYGYLTYMGNIPPEYGTIPQKQRMLSVLERLATTTSLDHVLFTFVLFKKSNIRDYLPLHQR